MWLIALEWVACSLCLLGGFMIARKMISGFWVTLVSDILLMVYSTLTFQFGLFMLAVGYGIINIYGIWYWLKHKT